jgi:N-acetylmuramate 1-kinase
MGAPDDISLEDLACELLAVAPGLSGARLDRVEHLAGDASGRRYFRLHLGSAPVPSVILLLPLAVAGPVAAGGDGRTQDATLVETTRYFSANGVRVPRLLLDARPAGALLLEDAGDVALRRFTLQPVDERAQRVATGLGPDPARVLFERAADLIAAIQACPPAPDCVAFQRSLGFEQYRTEAQRFVDFFLRPRGVNEGVALAVSWAVDQLAETVACHPRVLVHRDFMAWNLHVLEGGELVVLDHQDALLASHAYDLASLLNDRDVDFALGAELSADLGGYFVRRRRPGAGFERHYLEALLQRSLRLAGQFNLLSQRTGRDVYAGWVPGCLARIGRTLARMPGWEDLLDILAGSVPEIRQGADRPWERPEQVHPGHAARL